MIRIPVLRSALCCCVVSSLSISRVTSGSVPRRLVSLEVAASAERMRHFQERIQECNTVPPNVELAEFKVQGLKAGEVYLETADMLASYHEVFVFNPSTRTLGLVPDLEAATPAERTEAISKVTASLRKKGVVTGWRDELISVAPTRDHEPILSIERAAYPLMGVAGYGVHVNGFVRDPGAPGGLKLWVATRAKTKQTWPGLRDCIVAGQISDGLSPSRTVVLECEEEAGIPMAIAASARPCGAVSYRGVDEWGRLKRDVLFVFDLELPPDFKPTPTDGEVEDFELWDLDRVACLLEGTEQGKPFKPNVALVVIDFLVRHGFIEPDDPGYLPLVSSLRSGQCA